MFVVRSLVSPLNRLAPSLASASLAVALLAAGGCAGTAPSQTARPTSAPASDAISFDAARIAKQLAKLPRTPLDYDRSTLDATENKVVGKLVEASKFFDELHLRQVSAANPGLREQLRKLAASGAPGAGEALEYFEVNNGPWDRLDENRPFIGRTEKPKGAGFYPVDIGKDEFEKWVAAHPGDKETFEGLFTVIERDGKGLRAVPYSTVYRDFLEPAVAKIREAAALTGNASLRTYLEKRADALLSNDYYASDLAWMDLDSDLEVVIGPYEVYEDDLFNFKAAFQSFVTVRNRAESEKLVVYAGHLADMERNLPIADEFKNPNRGASSPIKVVDEIFTAGDARSTIQTAAFNLPNDERVREAKGSKKVLLKNVMEAKYRLAGKPIAERVLAPEELGLLSFDAYFDEILFHELSHGLGPGIIVGPDGKKVEMRLLLKNLHSTIEECKADIIGMWNILFAQKNGWVTAYDEKGLFATNAGVLYRSMRFGLNDAHGAGTAIQWNWHREQGAILPAEGGRWKVDFAKYRESVRLLGTELLMIEAKGDFAAAEKLIAKYGKSNAEIDGVIAKLEGIPVDFRPVYTAAGEK